MSHSKEDAAKKPISPEDRQRFKELFDKLDINRDGHIELSELQEGLSALHIDDSKKYAQKLMKKADTDKNKEINFEEFLVYMQQHENKLRLAFRGLDKDKDGHIDPKEIKEAFVKLGLNIDDAEADRLTKRIDRDGSLTLEWEEWRNFFTFLPSGDLEDMIKFWRQSLMIDIGDSLTVPPEFTKKEKASGAWWKHLVAGGMAGAVSRSCTAPLDRVKILLQVHGANANMGVVSGMKQMVQEGGVKALWRGNGTNVIKIAPESAIKFAAYEQLKNLIKADPNREVNVVERFAAGSTAGAFAQTCIYPLEVIKTRLAVSKTGQYKSILDCGIQTVQKGGIQALFRGYIPNLVGIIPYAGIDLSIYETLKQHYMHNNPQVKEPSVLLLLACGTVSSTCGQLASYPFALVRTRLQAGTSGETSMVPLAKSILLNEGPKGLYRGIAPNFLKVLPAVSISYVIYERAKSMLGIHKK